MKLFMVIGVVIIIVCVLLFCYFFLGKAPEQKNITWGVDFSQMQSESLGLDWKANYLALLDDLQVKNIKLHTQWDFVEGEKDTYYFDDIDWQLQQAQDHGASVIYVIGMKTGRWPECHIPGWANSLPEQQQQAELLTYMQQVVLRYKDNKAISYWQVENEPLFNFGQCPAWYYQNTDFLKKEVALVKSLDPSRKVIVSDSGEMSSWFEAANIGDILGTTMYRKTWVDISQYIPFTKGLGFYNSYSFPPVFYYRKAQLIKYFLGKDAICVELQAEPWTHQSLVNTSLQEQGKTMDAQLFKDNVAYAQQTGFNEVYLWGAEWWYWMKEKQNQPQIWDEARQLFAGQQL